MKILLSVAASALAVTALAGCSGDDEGGSANDPATNSETTEPTGPPTVGSYPAFDAANYTYRLEQICFCPITGPVEVTVEDGEVTSAVITKGGAGLPKGSAAPIYLRITINDVIARANDANAASVEVTWPDGQDWPDRVSVDKIEMATDDEITYVVSDVEVS